MNLTVTDKPAKFWFRAEYQYYKPLFHSEWQHLRRGTVSEPLTYEEFLHYFHHSHYILQGIKNETESLFLPSTNGKELFHYPVHDALLNDQQRAFDEILKNLHEEKPEPAVILKKALANLAKIDERRFVLTNLLESIKQGKNVVNTLRNYKELGITGVDVDSVNPYKPDSNNAFEKSAEDTSFKTDLGTFVQRLGKRLNKFALALMQVVINAMKAIPMFVGVKPSIGMVGPVPSLSFELEGEAVKLSELFEVLRSNAG